MRVPVVISLVLISSLTALVSAQKRTARRSPIVGEYLEYDPGNKELPSAPWGNTTFNIERSRRTQEYILWIGEKGTSSMNYHYADATRLRIDGQAGTLSFSYAADEEQCSFAAL